jgi:histidinol phosphatase-like enzyme (inositol monophosphatase family)
VGRVKTEPLLQAAHELARLMGEVALAHFRSDLLVESKADGSEVTIADLEAERLAREWIARRFPRDAVVGEELGERPGVSGRQWLIDPIDGTRSFVHGVPLWGSMVAVTGPDGILAGAISCAATGDLVAAAPGEGCWHNDSRTSVSSVASLREATILVTDPRFPGRPERASRWRALEPDVAVSRTWGDCYGYVLVATGRAELMADNRLSPWDVTALVPIIGEAGGVLTDWNGATGAGADAVATNAAIAEALRDRLGVPNTNVTPR